MPVQDIIEIRILPAFAIARLGSSPSPMDNYRLEMPDRVGYRTIVPADTFVVDTKTGKILSQKKPADVNFRDNRGRIRPIAPFLEIWAQFKRNGPFIPLTMQHLKELGLSPASLQWRVLLGNNKAFRRTKDPNDKILADTGFFSDHLKKPLQGKCANFLKGKKIPFGFGQFIKPTPRFPDIRFRFTPAGGFVYGPPTTAAEKRRADIRSLIKDAVYNPKKGWKGYVDRGDDPTITAPADIFANDGPRYTRSLGFLDDECDGFVEVKLKVKNKELGAYARILAGPPTFAPDGIPVRTVGDDLEQALFGPEVMGKVQRADVNNIIRRVLETVRLMNTAKMNEEVGMPVMDADPDSGFGRAPGPIMNPDTVDNLAILSRHEQVLLSLYSGSLAWFARILRDYDQVGDLTDEGRRRMPALMRGADGSHLALTRRMIDKIRKAADLFTQHKPVPKKPKKVKTESQLI